MSEMDSPDQVRVRLVKVTNGLHFVLEDRYDGVPFKIAPGRSENIPLDAAQHIFGYAYPGDRSVMFRHICKRFGWNTPDFTVAKEGEKSMAQKYFDKVKIEPLMFKMVPVNPEDDDPKRPIPADPEGAEAAAVEAMMPRRPPRRIEAPA